eukprot:CAMPEP_0184315970 /NCGR_PEP_ID=MMETSP1049-20130417/86990_1 /TAXON_ID=77928 /ORGANISM="Proteomonas sulcata, Strain CCMP704" /LENGTH=219 /DNA_ID=CAMNT_0026634739 /DNA_START=27 /DNA_END=686 /DNA_ORIENTATION=-
MKKLGYQGKALNDDPQRFADDNKVFEYDNINRFARYHDGGIGTWPGGQSTGGHSGLDYEFETARHLHPARSDIVTRAMKSDVWAVVSGDCKDINDVDDLQDCVKKSLKVDPSTTMGKKALNIAATQWHALRRPASEDVGNNQQEPSMEDVIEFNSRPEHLGKARAQMRGLQKQLDKVVNHRNFDTEHLTPDSNKYWLDATRDMCCKDMFDTECNSPCWV